MRTLGYKHWEILPSAPKTFLESLPELHPLLAQVLYNRGLIEPDVISAFLDRSLASDNPFLMKDMEPAVALIRKVISSGAPIIVYGDYDVDGMTATAILVLTLRSLGARVEAYIPSREDEGYGLNIEAIEALAQQGARLLITVDCGIRSLDEVALAQRLDLHVIVTDHHHVGAALPKADAVINPKQEECAYPFKDLAGAGVAFKLAQALLRVNRQVPLPTTQVVLEETDLLDLAALGTVADMVPLLGENHILVERGLVDINAARRPGISALIQAAGAQPGQITSQTIAFSLAPRLNAAGRLDEAMTALKLLLASDMAQALPLAQELDRLNRERQGLTTLVQEQARMIVLEQDGEPQPAAPDYVPPLLFAAAKDFPAGVVGLAANRLSEEFYRPAIVVSIEGEESKGSARSIPEFHITDALDAAADLLVRHGGHAAAAGFTARTMDLSRLKERLLALAGEKLKGKELVPKLEADAEVALGMLSWDVYNVLDKLRPFGFGNPSPVFISRRIEILNARAVGADGHHLKLYLMDEQGRSWDAIAFRQGEWIGRLPPRIDIAYVLQRNEWGGRVQLQLNIQDIHAPGEKEWPCEFS